MQLTKHAHACVVLTQDDTRIAVDPGTFTPDAAQVVAGAAAVLITHEHFDHFDEEVIAAALAARPELRVYGPESVVGRWTAARRGQVTAVAAGDAFAVAGVEVTVHGELHAAIHRDVPRVANVGYLVDGRVYHPGDAYHVPDAPVGTLLLPAAGPWTRTGDAVDYVREVAPGRLVQIHEAMLSEIGQRSMATILSPAMLSDVPLEIVPPGDTVEV
ncbi:MBL fold metallo-hydrolase [Kitasatospora phosalacinea]|uniref:MBL fold metallo-hydrolase n=1 Tax=Kitasatospora phosalacinea TaxID=2065 RepID=A0A9W6PKM0_9ACTN|nr:MBL fold metallo-hydrolase [Kitasatospora phosalacinea]GLW56527.1 MBL fold metallo-hydrolase [Kitasatospora phosalacinea]